MADKKGTKDTENQKVEEQVVNETETATQEQETNSEEAQSETPKEPSLEDKYQELNDKYLRLYSDFDNFRKRSAKERLRLTEQAGADIIKELLGIVDDFDRAIENNKNSEDAESIKEGFNLIANKLSGVLERKGVKPMDAKGKDFDTDHHEAITQIPAPEESLKGKVVDVVEKGYFLNDTVLRYAKVVIGQ